MILLIVLNFNNICWYQELLTFLTLQIPKVFLYMFK